MKILIQFLFVSFFLIEANNSFAQDTIHWRPGYKLKWEDFQGKPDSNSPYKAISTPAISYNLSVNEKKISYKVSCHFYKIKSWTKSDNQELLMHEQGHFDIAELFARKLRKKFAEYKFSSATISYDFREIYNKVVEEKDKMDSLYDKETNLSRNKQKQIYWNKKISSELKKLEAYKG
ncbi:MAG: DUF922 domain-containing protein [Bacteroidetes bacterium]|nr:DUF922 domain-containing protein [Bacteroidota bacterium]